MGETDHVEQPPLRVVLRWEPVPAEAARSDNDDFYAAVEPWFGVN